VVVDGDSGKILSNDPETDADLAAKKKKKASLALKGNAKIQGTVKMK
jgi:hypothetical protein